MEQGQRARQARLPDQQARPGLYDVSLVWSTDEGPLFDLPEVSLVPYLNLDDKFADHPKNDALSDGAFRLHVAGLCYCARNLTDGRIEQRRVHRLVPTYRAAYLHELLERGIWTEAPGGYEVHDYLQWNKSRSWWTEHREKEAKRIAAWRAKQRRVRGRVVDQGDGMGQQLEIGDS